jgi:glycosyltransferase involved in cell wall biosynthesis
MKMKRFIAVQIGARHSYAVPSILEKAGILETFYTDTVGNAGLEGKALNLIPKSLVRGSLENLLGRNLPNNLLSKTSTFPFLSLVHLFKKSLAGSNSRKNALLFTDFGEQLGKAIAKQGFGEATHYFSMFGECTPALRYAKENGLTTVTEIFIVLNAHYIVEKERAKYPKLETSLDQDLIEAGFTWIREVCSLSDFIIAPSLAVKEDLVKNFDVLPDRCFVVPYSVKDTWFEKNNLPNKGRILMVGTADLRKGIHILGMAAQKLKPKNYEFRIAGNVSESVKNSHITNSLNFLGRIPREKIQNEYLNADIFVLPSFAEGSASSTYEALACGLPVITTQASGSVVRNGIEGFIVPEGDARALADRIEELVENRELRDRMAIAARERAKDYTWEKYAERLNAVFQSV